MKFNFNFAIIIFAYERIDSMGSIKSKKIDDSKLYMDKAMRIPFDFKNDITIIDKCGLCYYSIKGNNVHDFKKNRFDHGNKKFYSIGIGPLKRNVVNQIINFNQPYIVIKDGTVIENYPIVVDDSYFLIQENLEPSFKTSFEFCRDDLIEHLSVSREWDVMFVKTNGEYISDDINDILPTENEIIRNYASSLKLYIERYKDEITDDSFKDFIDSCYNNLSMNLIPSNINVLSDDVFLVKVNGKTINLSQIKVFVIGDDKYKLDITGYKVTKYKNSELEVDNKKLILK